MFRTDAATCFSSGVRTFFLTFVRFTFFVFKANAVIHKMLVRIHIIANREELLQEESDPGLCCLSKPFCQALIFSKL